MDLRVKFLHLYFEKEHFVEFSNYKKKSRQNVPAKMFSLNVFLKLFLQNVFFNSRQMFFANVPAKWFLKSSCQMISRQMCTTKCARQILFLKMAGVSYKLASF